MSTPLATPATTESSTLYFGPWYRRSPFFEKTLEAGCSAYDIYNHMYLPGYYADPIEEANRQGPSPAARRRLRSRNSRPPPSAKPPF